MAPQQAGADFKDLFTGGILQCMEAATFGMPLEVMKTRQGSFPNENVFQAFNALKAKGYGAFWKGIDAKLTESFLKGGIFLFSKEYLEVVATYGGWAKGTFLNGAIAGVGAGVAQTVIMAPMTFIVTYKMNHPTSKSTIGVFQEVGVRKAFTGASAVALRQASNWGLRQGFVNLVQNQYQSFKGAPLSSTDKVVCGLVGGGLAAINHPVEVLRIRMQKARALNANAAITLPATAAAVYAEYGFMGFWAGVIPRIGLSAYQTLFMITFAKMVKEQLNKAMDLATGHPHPHSNTNANASAAGKK